MAYVEDQVELLSKIKQSVDQLRWGVGKIQNGLKKSKDAMVLQVSEIKNQLESRSQLLETMSETSRRLDPANCELGAAEKPIATSSDSQNQVIPIFPDLHRSDAELGYRGISGALANRERIWYKVDMPVFNGSSPFGWVARVERFFRLGNYSDEQKLDLVSVSLAGPALSWFNWEIEHELFKNWADFKQRMLDRFGQSWLDLQEKVVLKKELISQNVEEPKSSCVKISLATKTTSEDDTSWKEEAILQQHSFPKEVSSISVLEYDHSDKILGGDFGTNVVTENSVPEVLSPLLVDFHLDVAESGEQSPCVQSTHSAYKVFDILTCRGSRLWYKQKHRKSSKSWRYKFKPMRQHQFMQQNAHKLIDRKFLWNIRRRRHSTCMKQVIFTLQDDGPMVFKGVSPFTFSYQTEPKDMEEANGPEMVMTSAESTGFKITPSVYQLCDALPLLTETIHMKLEKDKLSKSWKFKFKLRPSTAVLNMAPLSFEDFTTENSGPTVSGPFLVDLSLGYGSNAEFVHRKELVHVFPTRDVVKWSQFLKNICRIHHSTSRQQFLKGYEVAGFVRKKTDSWLLWISWFESYTEAIRLFSSSTCIHVTCFVLTKHDDILSTTKKLKCCKSWHFKYKIKIRGRNNVGTMQFIFSRRLVNRPLSLENKGGSESSDHHQQKQEEEMTERLGSSALVRARRKHWEARQSPNQSQSMVRRQTFFAIWHRWRTRDCIQA